ncbi:SGNH/GDSL hydrolase family protein [Chitinibacteraceae bacterium HSL-7]
MKKKNLLALMLATALAGCGGGGAGEYVEPPKPADQAGIGRLIVFGDSLSDAGTYNPTTADADASNDVPVGLRFTTKPGGTWTTTVAIGLGLALTPNQQVNFGVVGQAGKVIELGGSSYAEGGARLTVDAAANGVVNQTIPGVGTVPVQMATARSVNTQITDFLAENGGAFKATDLVLIQGGANDFFNFFQTTAPADLATNAPAFVQNTVTAMVTQIGRLQAAGAKRIVWSNMPELGITPQFLALGAATAAQATQLSKSYNQAVAQQLASMKVGVFDVASLLNQVAATPAPYGFANVTQPACTSRTTPSDPSTLTALICTSSTLVAADADQTHLFADNVHPTANAHAIWGKAVLAQLAAQ